MRNEAKNCVIRESLIPFFGQVVDEMVAREMKDNGV